MTPGDASTFEGLLHDGEEVVDAVTVSGGTVGVTTHRVIALTPDAPGANVRTVARPNVESIGADNAGAAAHLVRAARYGVYAAAMFGGSYVVSFDSIAAVDPSVSAAGAGEVVGTAMQLTNLLSAVDEVLRAGGVVMALAALVFVALYGHSRGRYLRVGVAGDDDVRVPLRRGEPAGADRLRAAVEKASNPPAG